MSSVADGSTYSAPVVESGSSFHSSRITNATSSPLSWVFSPIVAHAVARSLPVRAALAGCRDERADDVGPARRPGDRQRGEVAKIRRRPARTAVRGRLRRGRRLPLRVSRHLDLVLLGAETGVDACERDSLLVERDPDLLYMRDRWPISPASRTSTRHDGTGPAPGPSSEPQLLPRQASRRQGNPSHRPAGHKTR
jgi:hypothetical protein